MLKRKSFKGDDEITNVEEYNWLLKTQMFEFENENGCLYTVCHFE